MGVGARYRERERRFRKRLLPGARGAGELSRRWVFFYTKIRQDDSLAVFEDVARRAAAKFYNGIVLGTNTAFHAAINEDVRSKLKEIRKIARAHGLDVVPTAFGVGGPWDIMYYKDELVHYGAGYLVDGALFEVVDPGDRAIHVPHVDFAYGFDDTEYGQSFYTIDTGDSVVYSIGLGEVGTSSFPDLEVGKTAPPSLRVENPQGLAYFRVFCNNLIPRRQYKLSFWIKTEGIDSTELGVGAAIWSDPYRWYGFCKEEYTIEPTSDWQKIEFGFNSMSFDSVIIVAAVNDVTTGKVWFDDVEFKEIGLVNVLRRPGTPVMVCDADDGTLYVEGVDYGYIEDPNINKAYMPNHDGPPIEILAGGRIAEKFERTGGTRLRVSYYHGTAGGLRYPSPCLSEPRVYQTYMEQYEILCSVLPHKAVLMGIDEVRSGLGCAACRRIGTPAQVMSNCANQLAAIVRKVNPGAEVLTWADMYTPYHNAVERYYGIDGSLVGSWERVSRDITMVVWGGTPYYRSYKRPGCLGDSLKFFSDLGFRTMVAAYYDVSDPEQLTQRTRDWIEFALATPHCDGMMYTTWTPRYDDLELFADIMLSYDGI